MVNYTPTSIDLLTQEKPNFFSQPTPTNAPGAMQYTNGGRASMLPPTTSAAPAPVAAAPSTAAPAYEPTIGETLTGIKQQAMTIQDQLNATKAPGKLNNPTYETGPTYAELYPEIDERKVARNQRRLFQAEIDATNRVYDDMLAQERLAGQGRLGTGRAIAARGGLLGSDFGEAQRNTIVGANSDAQRAVQNERSAKIGVIMGTMRKAVADELTEKRAARQQGAENYISYLASARERKENNRNLAARAILDAGLDPTTMDPAELEAVGKEAGLTAQEIIMAYKDLQTASEAEGLKSSKTQAEIAKLEADTANAGFFELSEGQSRYDANGNVIASKGKTYAPGTGSDSSINLTADDKRTLLGGGWSESDISTLESGIRSEGLQSVIAAEKAAGATPAQIKALEKAYGSTSTEASQFLNKDYFRSLFGDEALKASAKEAGVVSGGNDYIPFNEGGDTEAYLTQLEQTVNLYRQAGYTDQEILKMMQ